MSTQEGRTRRGRGSTQVKPDPEEGGRRLRRRVNEEPEGQQAGDEAGPSSTPGAGSNYDQRIDQLAKQYESEAEAKNVAGKLSREEADQLIGLVVRHMLFKQHAHPDIPVTRAELTDLVSRHVRAKRHNVGAYVVSAAQALMARAMGIHMEELTRKQKSGGEGVKCYVLRSLLPAALRVRYLRDADDDAPHALILLVLAIIKINNEKILEEELWRLLEEVGLSKDEAHHPAFGPTKDLLAGFVKKRYLVESRVQGPEGETRQYVWGENAESEFAGGEVDKWIKEMYERNNA